MMLVLYLLNDCHPRLPKKNVYARMQQNRLRAFRQLYQHCHHQQVDLLENLQVLQVYPQLLEVSIGFQYYHNTQDGLKNPYHLCVHLYCI